MNDQTTGMLGGVLAGYATSPCDHGVAVPGRSARAGPYGRHRLRRRRPSEALAGPGVQRWSGVEVGGFEPFDELDLWLATVVDGSGLLAAKKTAIDSGPVAASTRMGAKTAMAGGAMVATAPRHGRFNNAVPS